MRVLAGEQAPGATRAKALSIVRRVIEIRPSDMATPPPVELVAVLLEALTLRTPELTHEAAWDSIGVSESLGRGLLGARASSMTWPIFRTLRDAAFEGPEE